MKLRPKWFNDVNFAVVQPQNSRFCNSYFGSFRLIRYEGKWKKIQKKVYKTMPSHSNIYCKLALKWSVRTVREGSQFAFVIMIIASFFHFFPILFSWLWNHVQIRRHKNKIRFGGSLRGGSGWRFPLVQLSFGWFLGGFCWLRIISDGFR